MIPSWPQTSAGTSRSPDRHHFSGPYVTSVGGTTNFRPEIAANLSGGGFSFYFPRPDYQRSVVLEYLRAHIDFYDGLYKYVRYRDLSLSYFLIRAALMVVVTPTSPHKRLITNFSIMARCIT